MTKTVRRKILRANAIWLVIAASGGLLMDVLGIFFGRGPQSGIGAVAPQAGVGLIEAHGLALIFGVLLWHAERPLRYWHFTAATAHALLGVANLVFWQYFIAGGMLVAGYLTTLLHWLFVALQLWAAIGTLKPITKNTGMALSAALCRRYSTRY